MEDWEIVQFREAVLCGNWDIVEKFLPTVQMSNLSADQQKESLFLVRQQKYLELLSARDLVKAIEILQNELRPLCESSGRLHELCRYGAPSRKVLPCLTDSLCSYIMYPSTPTTDTNHTPSREQLLDQLGGKKFPVNSASCSFNLHVAFITISLYRAFKYDTQRTSPQAARTSIGVAKEKLLLSQH